MDAAAKFDPQRAADYHQQSRIALAGYDACHELAACILAASLGDDARGRPARLLIVGAGGGGQEIITAAALEPAWQFTAVDPAPAMMALTVERLTAAGLDHRTCFHQGTVDDLPAGPAFDAATIIGVLHHLPGDPAKQALLASVAARLAPGAPLILAGNGLAYRDHPLLLAAWAERWRLYGADPAEQSARLAKILAGADPPASEAAVADLLRAAGFGPPQRFFASLFWGAWISRRADTLPAGVA